MTVSRIFFFHVDFHLRVCETDKANENDVNELSFKKGDILLIFNMDSKWWEAQASDGKKGSAYLLLSLRLLFGTHHRLCIVVPSNYLRLFE